MTPPEARPTPQPETKFVNPNISYTEQEIKYAPNHQIRIGLKAEQGGIDNFRHVHGQDYVASNMETVKTTGGYPTMAVVDGISIVSKKTQIANISAGLAREGAQRIVNVATEEPLTDALVKRVSRELYPQFTSTTEIGRATLVAAQYDPNSREVRFAGIGDSQAFVVEIDSEGVIKVYNIGETLQRGMLREQDVLRQAFGDQKPPVNNTIHQFSHDTQRAFVIIASDGVRTQRDVKRIAPDKLLQIVQSLQKRNNLSTATLTTRLLQQSNQIWEFYPPEKKDDQSIAIMELDFRKGNDQADASVGTFESKAISPDQILETLRKARIPLTNFWEQRLAPETAKPPTTQEIEQVLQAIGQLTGKESPSQWAIQQAVQFMRLWNQIVEKGQPVDQGQLTYVTRQAGLREILRAANKVIQNERPGLINRIKKAFRASAPSNRVYNIFKEAQASLAGTQNYIRRALQRATTLQQIVKILQHTPVLISKDAWYPTAGYQLLLQQTIATGSVPRFRAITNAAGLRHATRRIWLKQNGNRDALGHK